MAAFCFTMLELVLCDTTVYMSLKCSRKTANINITSGYATWFTAGGAIRIAHYDVIDDVIMTSLKFDTEEGTFGPLLRAKFHPHRCNVSPLRGEKPQNRPVSKLNTVRFALRAMLPVKIALNAVRLPKFETVNGKSWSPAFGSLVGQ